MGLRAGGRRRTTGGQNAALKDQAGPSFAPPPWLLSSCSVAGARRGLGRRGAARLVVDGGEDVGVAEEDVLLRRGGVARKGNRVRVRSSRRQIKKVSACRGCALSSGGSARALCRAELRRQRLKARAARGGARTLSASLMEVPPNSGRSTRSPGLTWHGTSSPVYNHVR